MAKANVGARAKLAIGTWRYYRLLRNANERKGKAGELARAKFLKAFPQGASK